MPITETQARLWFDNEEERKAYDDKMLANIELKSLDFDDENFSPVFNRATQEVFLHPSERFRSDFHKAYSPFKSVSYEEAINKWVLFTPNHTHWREGTITKWTSGFLFGYILLRELPLRNFYARCFVMWVGFAKLFDHMTTWWPYFGAQGQLLVAADRFAFWDLRCYDNVMRAKRFIYIPSVMNKVKEAKVWSGKQPAHILRADYFYAPHYFTAPKRRNQQAHWDGTMNMPLYRLADPRSKDSYMMHAH